MRNATRISRMGGCSSRRFRSAPRLRVAAGRRWRRERRGRRGDILGTGGVGGGVGGGGGGITGTGTGGVPAACAGPSDARLVVASQRILRLTMNETLNTVRYLFGTTEAAALVSAGIIGTADDSTDLNRRFPPLAALPESNITGPASPSSNRSRITSRAMCSTISHRSRRVPPPPTRAHARTSTSWRRERTGGRSRPTSSPGSRRFTRSCAAADGPGVRGHLHRRGSHQLRGPRAARLAADALALGARRSREASAAPVGIPLSDHELATQLAFFLTIGLPTTRCWRRRARGRFARTWRRTWTRCSRLRPPAIGCGRSSRRTSSSTRCRKWGRRGQTSVLLAGACCRPGHRVAHVPR